MIKVLSGLGLFFGFILNSKNVQNERTSPYTHVVDSLLQYVNKSAVSTGILYDRVAPFARLDAFRPGKDTTGYQHFRQAYSELYMSHYHPEGKLISPDDVDAIAEWRQYQRTVPLGIMDMKYQRIDPAALKNKQLVMRKGRLYNNAASQTPPFISSRLQMATLMVDKLQPGRNVIKFCPELFLNNSGEKISRVNLVFSNGVGTYSLSREDSVVVVNLPQNEVINLNATVVFENGNEFKSKSVVETAQMENKRSLYVANLPAGPCYTDTITADIPFEGYDELRSLRGQVELNYYYRAGANDATDCRKKLSKPIIVLDGFDPTDKRDANFIYNYNFHYYNQQGKAANFADELRLQGYDVVIINMPRYQVGTRNILLPNGDNLEIGMLMRAGGDYIERNALVLVKVLQNIKTELRANGSNEQVVIVGPSMGGLISRYALSYMEKHNMDHNCRLWFSWDATHLGSVLPIGEQYFIKSMANLGLKGAKDGIEQQLNTPASKQELNHHHLAEAIDPEGAPGFKNRFYDEMKYIGFPEKCRKIAMISGTINGTMQPDGTAGQTAFDFKLKMNRKPRLLMFNVLGLIANPDFIKAKIHFSPALKNGDAPAEVFSMKILGLKSTKTYATPFTKSNNSLDLIPGGFYPGFKEIRDSTRTKMHGFFNWLVDPQFLNVVENHCHQPSMNTLGFGLGPHPNPARKWDDDLSEVNFNCGDEKEIPWDAWYAPEVNLRHDSLTYEYVWRMMDEINGKQMPQPKPTKHLAISGDTALMVPGEIRQFAVAAGKDKTAHFNWSTSNPQLQIVKGQGTDTVTVQYLGSVNSTVALSCTGEGNCYNYASRSFTLSHFDEAAGGQYAATTALQPTAVVVSLPTTNAVATNYQLVDMQGRVLATQTANATGKVAFANLPVHKSDLYILRTLNGEQVVNERKMLLQ
jgi:hypothetical protein